MESLWDETLGTRNEQVYGRLVEYLGGETKYHWWIWSMFNASEGDGRNVWWTNSECTEILDGDTRFPRQGEMIEFMRRWISPLNDQIKKSHLLGIYGLETLVKQRRIEFHSDLLPIVLFCLHHTDHSIKLVSLSVLSHLSIHIREHIPLIGPMFEQQLSFRNPLLYSQLIPLMMSICAAKDSQHIRGILQRFCEELEYHSVSNNKENIEIHCILLYGVVDGMKFVDQHQLLLYTSSLLGSCLVSCCSDHEPIREAALNALNALSDSEWVKKAHSRKIKATVSKYSGNRIADEILDKLV